MSLIKLKIILLFKSLFIDLKRNFFLIAFGLLLLLFIIIKWWFVFIYIGYLIYIYKKNKRILIFLMGISILFLLVYYLNIYYIKKDIKEIKGIVIGIKENEDYTKITILKGLNKIIAISPNKINLEISDKVIINGYFKEISTNKNEYEFNYYEYLLGYRCHNIVNIEEIEISKSINIFTIRKLLIRYINYFFNGESNYYIKALILGDSSLINEIDLENIKINGISHLFAISGLHISLIVGMITKLLQILKCKDKLIIKIITIFLLLYIIITNFSPSVLRASFLYFLNNINKNKKLNLSSLDIISIIFILFIIINPVFMYNLSFKLSFLVSFFIIILSKLINKLKEKYKFNMIIELIIITLLIQILSLPVVININHRINIASLFSNSIFIIYMSYILLPFIIITLLIPILHYPLELLIKCFSFLNSFSKDYLRLDIYLPHMDIIEIVIFYLFITIIILLINKKSRIIIFGIISFIIFFTFFYNKIYLNNQTKISFLALHEGESIIIDLEYNKGVIIIDTGTGYNNSLCNYCYSHGIRKIDALFLTHNHLDHFGEANDLVNNFKVKEIIKSIYDNSDVKETISVKKGDIVRVSDIEFIIHNPSSDSLDINSLSLVIETEIEGIKYLFLGDTPKEIERKIINDIGDIDIVKVGHHGSNTSTDESFYNKINPKVCIIQTGEIEYYHFPNYDVMKILDKYKVYRTDLDYEIIIKSKNKKIRVETLK